MTKHGTAITWTHWPGTKGETWTVVRGCRLANYVDASGKHKPFKTCVGCYAMVQAHSLVQRFDMPQYRGLTVTTSVGPLWNGEINFDEEQLLWPLRCKKRRTFFLTSMGDVFYTGVSDDQIARIIAVMVVSDMRCLHHNFLVLTKRPDRMIRLLHDSKFLGLVMHYAAILMVPSGVTEERLLSALWMGHIWWGASVENGPTLKWVADQFNRAYRLGRFWISYEPVIDYDAGAFRNILKVVRWVVAGGASRQRGIVWPFDLHSARQIIHECKRARTLLYIKQLGADIVDQGTPIGLRNMDNHNADPEQWPLDYRVQEFPTP